MRPATTAILPFVVLVACKMGPAEPEPQQRASTPAKTAEPGTTTAAQLGGATGSSSPSSGGVTGADPHSGSFSLADATKDLKGSGPIVAKIDTSKGALQCRLFDDKAPVTVANFIGLATGRRAWKDGAKWVNKPAYDGTSFHRVIRGFMIQGGDPKGDGTGEPGYVIKDELWQGAKHDRAGLLCMANRGPNTNGAQFFVTDAAAAHLDTSYTIFGECAPVEVVHEIAAVQTGPRDKPVSAIAIKSITISRDERAKK